MKRAELIWDNIHVYRVNTYWEQYDLEITHTSEYFCDATVHILQINKPWYILDMYDDKDNTWL